MMKSMQKLVLSSKRKLIDDKLRKAEQNRLRAIEEDNIAQSKRETENQRLLNIANENKEKELTKRREAIDKEIAYLEESLEQINQEIKELNAPVVVDFVTALQSNAEAYSNSQEESKKLKDEIYKKQSYNIDYLSLMGLKIAISMVLAMVIGKLTVSSPELVQSLIAYSYFSNIESLGESLVLFIDFLTQEFLIVFTLSASLTWIFRDANFIHNSKFKYICILLIIISLVSIIVLSTLPE